MKKNFLKLLLAVLLIPVFINASTFNESKSIVNDYCTKVDADGRYLRCKTSLNYGFSNEKKITSISGFEKGGLLNEYEFNISKSNKVNDKKIMPYLAPGVAYWLIDGKAVETGVTSVSDAGTRPTEYVKHVVRATGTGTRENAWEFEDIYKVTLSVTNKGGSVIDEIKFVNKNADTELKFKANDGFAVDTVVCDGIPSSNVVPSYNFVQIKNVNKDTDCKITFQKLTKAQVVFNYYKESLNNNDYELYNTKTTLYKEGEKVSIDKTYTPIVNNPADKELYVVSNIKKGKSSGFASIDNSLVLDIYYDLVNVVDVKANVTGVKDAESGEIIKLKVNLKNRKNTPIEVTLNDEKLKTARNNNKITDIDEILKAITDSGYTIKLEANESKDIEYSFKVNEVPGKQIKSQLTYTVKNRGTVTTDEISIGVEKIISLVERNNNTPGANVAIVLDVSGSMNWGRNANNVYEWNGGRIDSARKAIESFINEAFNDKDNTKIRFVTFESSAKIVGDIAQDRASADALITNVKKVVASGGTAYHAGLNKAYEALYSGTNNLHSKWPNNKNIIIFLSDGNPEHSTPQQIETSRNNVINSKTLNADIYTIGYDLESDYTKGVLRDLSYPNAEDKKAANPNAKPEELTNDHYFEASPNNVSEIFSKIYHFIDTLNDQRTSGGFVRISSNAIVNANRKLVIKCGAIKLEYTSLDALASSEYGKKENGAYYVDAAKFAAADKVEITYFIPDNN